MRVWVAVVLLAGGACRSDDDAAPTTISSTTTTSAPGPTVPPWIVFQQTAGGEKLFLARADGAELHSPTVRLTGGDQLNPDWSPEGERLVFVLGGDLWTVNVDGTDAKLLLACEDTCIELDDPAWSPDGASILFSRHSEIDGDLADTLETVRLDDGRVEVLLTAAAQTLYAGQRWSPDGTSLVLEVVHYTEPSLDSEVDGVVLSIVDLATRPLSARPLTDPLLFSETADWDSSGETFVFAALASAGGDAKDLFRMQADGTGLTRLTTLADAGGEATHPDVTENGTIVFTAQALAAGGDYVLARVGQDGGEPSPTLGDEYVAGVHPRVQPVP